MSVFEIIMLVCFGLAWPVSIFRSYKSRSTGGKSPVFSVVIIIGYIAGAINKIVYNFDFVFYLYLLNMVMVTIDLALWFRNRRIEKLSSYKGKTT